MPRQIPLSTASPTQKQPRPRDGLRGGEDESQINVTLLHKLQKEFGIVVGPIEWSSLSRAHRFNSTDRSPAPTPAGLLDSLMLGCRLSVGGGSGMWSPERQATWSARGGARSHLTPGRVLMSNVPQGKSTVLSPCSHLVLAPGRHPESA